MRDIGIIELLFVNQLRSYPRSSAKSAFKTLLTEISQALTPLNIEHCHTMEDCVKAGNNMLVTFTL